jgi:hypothetical protein
MQLATPTTHILRFEVLHLPDGGKAKDSCTVLAV